MSDAPLSDAQLMLERLVTEWQAPLTAMIEISDRCNEVCVHCYQQQGNKGEMTTEQLYAVMDQLADLGVLVLTISGGEATLRADFLQIIEYARRKDFAIRLFTNGLTMTCELAQTLGRLAVHAVEISLYSTQAELHDFVTGVRGSFERTVAGVRNLVEAGVPVTVKSPVMSLNEHEIDAYVAFAAQLGAEFMWGGGEIMAREGGDRSPEVFDSSDRARMRLVREFGSGGVSASAELPLRPLDTPPCGAGESIHIEPNGELRACTMLEVDLGHALRDGLARARTENERLVGLQQLTWTHMHGCRECDLRAVCEHCYAAALAQVGDALGPYPGACRSAALNYEVRTGHAPRILAPVASGCGPYRALGDHTFQAFADHVSVEDDALAARLGWSRRSHATSRAPVLAARPGELIQIRRPGRKKSSLERIPPADGA